VKVNISKKSARAPLTDTLAQRFWDKVHHEPNTGCWLWSGAADHLGYGSIRINKRTFRAYRVAWELTNGAIPSGLEVCHRCDHPPCVNPEHLFLGTHADNMADMRRKGRMRMPNTRGESNSNAKLTDALALEIFRRCLDVGGCGQREIARQLGVHHMVVNHIWKRRSWRHVTTSHFPEVAHG
jgi:hypothetical protein